jgi:hypothetical protein
MSLIWFLEIVSFLFGILIFKFEIIDQKCKNFIPSIFLLLYVPLFSITPLLYHIVLGGAMSIDHKTEGLVYTNENFYYIYHLYNLILLTSFFVCGLYNKTFQKAIKIDLNRNKKSENIILISFLIFGIYLYIHSTGLTIFELLIAGRFSWFENSNYSSFESVLASYFISLTPLIIFIYLKNKKLLYLIFTIVLLIIYGVLAKDRKWVIFIISGLFSFFYFFNGNKINFKFRTLLLSLIFGLILVFWQVFRDVLFNELLSGKGDFFVQANEMAQKLLIKGDLPYYYFASITSIKMNFIDGFEIPFGIIRRQMFMFIPADYSFGLKIKDISAIFSDALDAGDQIRGGNMPPGLIGLFVLSFKWWGGVFFYSLIPFILFYLNNIASKFNSIITAVIYSNCFSFFILLLRGDDSSAFYFLFFNLMIYYLINSDFYRNKNR